METFKDKWADLRRYTPLMVVVVFSVIVGVVGVAVTAWDYLTYEPVEADQGVVMNIAATGVALGIYFLLFIVFSALILWHKTFGYSGLLLTYVILAVITAAVFGGGNIPLGVVMGLSAAVNIILLFMPASRQWYQERFEER